MAVPANNSTHLEDVPFTVRHLAEAGDHYDVVIANVGYELRSIAVIERVRSAAKHFLISAYSSRTVESYWGNLKQLSAWGLSPVIESDSEFVDSFDTRLSAVIRTLAAPARICVDVSSASRPRIAAMLTSVLRHLDIVSVDFLYVPGQYDDPSDDSDVLRSAGPVIPEFAGMSLSSDLPVCAFLGLGFERLEAMAAYQYLDPRETWLFVPVDMARDYLGVVESRNSDLIQIVGEQNVIRYGVSEPAALYTFLESLTLGYRDIGRPILVPLGPKIFALVTLLVSARFGYETPVWRFSSDQASQARDVKPSEETFGLTVARASEVIA